MAVALGIIAFLLAFALGVVIVIKIKGWKQQMKASEAKATAVQHLYEELMAQSFQKEEQHLAIEAKLMENLGRLMEKQEEIKRTYKAQLANCERMRHTYKASALSLTNHVEELQESFTAVMIQSSKSEKDHLAKEAELNQDLRACADKVRCLEIELLETKRSHKAKIEERECSIKALKETLKQLQEEQETRNKKPLQHLVVEEGTALQGQVKMENTPNQQSHSPQVSQPNGSSETTKPFNIEVGSVDEEVLETRKREETLQVLQPSVSSEESSGKKCQVKTEHLTTQEQQQILQGSQHSVRSKTANKKVCVLRFGSVSDTIGRLQTIPEEEETLQVPQPSVSSEESSGKKCQFKRNHLTTQEQQQIPQVSQHSVRSKTANKKVCVLRFGSMLDTFRRRQTTQEHQQALLMSQPSVSTNRRWWTTQEHQQALLMSQPSVSSEENVWDNNRRLQTIPEQNGHSPPAGVGLPHSSLHPSQL
ncbi:hypothetical protein AAFF_G00101080 [Aldrovandia affinis]|uniref:Uncharacterized protein n=1 Tax=Aldrovandia affinis TaxID=143900 RepID=A0AAD7RUW5_9TELE|nr:hypothetical protein AAFF_G00101080 [Aldrovandia affinis]